MNYQEFKAIYKNVLKKFSYDITNLYAVHDISRTITRYEKRGSRWIEVEKEIKLVSYEFYFNIFDSIQFMKNLGGYERTTKAYTKYGYIPVEQISISPDRSKKTVFSFSFENAKNADLR